MTLLVLWAIWTTVCVAQSTGSTIECPKNCTCQENVGAEETTTTIRCSSLPDVLPSGVSTLSVYKLQEPILRTQQLVPYANVQVLNLSDTGLVGIENADDSQNLWNLKSLLLSANRLLRLNATTFNFCPGVTELALNDNRIKSVDQQTFAGLNSLRRLDLAGNRLTTLQFGLPPSLVVLDVGNNQLTDTALSGSLLKLAELNLCGNEYDVFTIGGLRLPELSNLCLGDAIETVEAGSLSSLPNLTNLTVVGKRNVSATLEKEFQLLGRLRSLTLSYLSLPSISGRWLSHFPSLQELHLVEIDSADGFNSGVLQSLVNLTLLDLRRSPTLVASLCSLMTVKEASRAVGAPLSFANGPTVTYLDISENPLYCSANLRELLRAILRDRIRLLNSDETLCAEPPAVAGQQLTDLQSVQQILTTPGNESKLIGDSGATNATNSTEVPTPPRGIYYYLDHWGITTDHLLYTILALTIAVLVLLMVLLIVTHLKCRQRSNYRPQRDGSDESFMMRADSEYTFDNFTLSETMAECRRSPNSTLNRNRKPVQK